MTAVTGAGFWLDQFQDPIAITGTDGIIVFVNQAWRRFCDENGGDLDRGGVGSNYLDICRSAPDHPDAAQVATGLRDVLSGAIESFSHEYPCHSPTAMRWYNVSLSAFTGADGRQAIISHRRLTGPTPATDELDHYHGRLEPVTGVANRFHLLDRLDRALGAGRRQGRGVVLVAINIRNFGALNATYGYRIGDVVLRELAGRLLNVIDDTGMVASMGGDKFLVLLRGVGDAAALQSALAKISVALGSVINVQGEELRLRSCLGVADCFACDTDAYTLVGQAEVALRSTRDQPKSSVAYHSSSLQEAIRLRTRLTAELNEALRTDQFALYLQPQVDAQSGALVGAEALLRWNHPVRGLVSPADFIPAVEESGLASDVFAWVMEEACRILKLWQGRLRGTISLNLSGSQLADAGLATSVMETLRRHDVPAGAVRLEVTEDSLIRDMDAAVTTLRDLSEAGVSTSIDDFGTGYSSLQYLARLPVDEIKVDRAFVQALPGEPRDTALVQAIANLADAYDLRVVAEGVETDEQAREVRRIGCSVIQGFLFGRPAPLEVFEATWLSG
ncbi:diguanylate cyclase [Caenispirillum salinarum AK4]|uniref:Diguanylate cyclase n=1 Tax=Caenispirillum salinarum AK4 TaxID=1238182 RepID=K9HF36_9PROT|nr:EAL domain-containing protein [Caenispirillum salinarum]EKV27291.1 diguanylate cyclase [Caenispirillum salinarum AK4]